MGIELFFFWIKVMASNISSKFQNHQHHYKPLWILNNTFTTKVIKVQVLVVVDVRIKMLLKGNTIFNPTEVPPPRCAPLLPACNTRTTARNISSPPYWSCRQCKLVILSSGFVRADPKWDTGLCPMVSYPFTNSLHDFKS
jgi:hypothetical protein